MCGICGVISADRNEVEPAVRRMMQAMVHRGPDDEGYDELPLGADESGPLLGLGFRRLSILDLSPAGHQPMFNANTGDCLVFNGEIYNFKTLRSRLQLQGSIFRGHSDTEVLLAALSTWGDSAIGMLEGMFAFAWYSPRHRRVLLARDQSGIKPVYWTERDGQFAFASEIKALCELNWLDRRVNPRAAVSYISNLCAPHTSTMFASVRRLAPGHLLTWDISRGISIRRYAGHNYSLPRLATTPAAAADECRRLLTTAVERQLVADVPVGGFLSGGVDSSSVAAIAAKTLASPDRYPVFTIELRDHLQQQRDGFSEDLPYAEAMARHLGVPLTLVPVLDDDMLNIDAMVWQLDEPIADPAAMNVSVICAAARAAGIKVLLSGAGADDVFSGYRRHQSLMFQNIWMWMPRPLLQALRSGSAIIPAQWSSARRLSRLFRDSNFPENERIARAFAWVSGHSAKKLLAPDVAARLGNWSPEDEYLWSLAQLPSGTHRLDRMLYLEQQHFLADHNLIYTDKMSMAHSVEVRVPFLDTPLVQFAEQLPAGLKHRTFQGKSVLRDAVANLLPKNVVRRPKTGFGINLRRLLKTRFLPLLTQLADSRGPVCGGLVDPASLRALVESHNQGASDAAYPLLAVLCLESWMRQFRGVV
jgi:asparagine synthase (glutamine-hydrolysing)